MWNTEGAEKQPYYFTDKQEPILAIAGLWNEWEDKQAGKSLLTATMVITEPNKFVAQYHDRMPVLLKPNQFDKWLSGRPARKSSSQHPRTCCRLGQ